MLRNYLPAVFGLAFSIMLNTGAQAQFDDPDVYIAAGGGGAVLMDTVITEKATGTTYETLPFPGYALTGAVGLDSVCFDWRAKRSIIATIWILLNRPGST